MSLSADADHDINMSTEDVNSADVSETMLGRLLKQSLNSAVEKAVGEAVEKTLRDAVEKVMSCTVEKALKKTVEEQVQNAFGKAAKLVSENSTEAHPSSSISTSNNEKPLQGPTVIDLTEYQTGEIKVEEESSANLDDSVQAGRTYLIYYKSCCWRKIGVSEAFWIETTRARLDNDSFCKPSLYFQWKCIEKNGRFQFQNEATESFLKLENEGGGDYSWTTTQNGKDDYTMFRLQQKLPDAYTLHSLFYNTWAGVTFHHFERTPCGIHRCEPVDDHYPNYLWKFKRVLEG